MATLKFLTVIHTTSRTADADTEDGFKLRILGAINPDATVAVLTFPDLPHDERERGRTDEYKFDVEDLDLDMFGLNERNFELIALGDDAWLPATMWVIGQDIRGTRELLASVPIWPTNAWLSTDDSEGEAVRRLDLPAPPFG